jgi:hypothetical protein
MERIYVSPYKPDQDLPIGQETPTAPQVPQVSPDAGTGWSPLKWLQGLYGGGSDAQGAARPNWMIEPDYQGTLTGELPPGVVPSTNERDQRPVYQDTGEPLTMIPRPGVLPFVKTPDGYQMVMPKLADLASYVMGGSVPLKGAEVALGAGMIRRPVQAAADAAEAAAAAKAPAEVTHSPEVLQAIARHQAALRGDPVIEANPRAVIGANQPPAMRQVAPVETPPGDPFTPVRTERIIPPQAAPAEPTALEKLRTLPPEEVTPKAAQDALREQYGPIGTHPDERALTVNDILHPDTPGMKPRSRNVQDIAKELETRGQGALRELGVENGKIETFDNPEHNEILSRAIASEIKAEMGRGGNTAHNWYTTAIDEAMQHAAAIWPELATDPHARMGFTGALSIASQGETVASNVRLAEKIYEEFRQTGRFPTNVKAKNGPAMNENFDKLNNLLDTMGPEQMRDFLHREMTVKDLANMGHDIGGENMGTKVYGSSILGPKIGQGFFQNLNGNYNPVTMDLWFMRAMGRLTGKLVGGPMEKPTARFQNALKAEGGRAWKDPEKLTKLAEDIMAKHEKDFKVNRDLYDSKERTKSELTKAADRYLFNQSGINETPKGGGHRDWMRGLVHRARELLSEEGHDLTPADLQAIWWYPEKRLYSKLGGRDSEGINTDYAAVLRQLRAERGK